MPKAEKPNASYLFELIKSLSKSEKGYFKKYYCKEDKGEKNSYVVLFDMLDGFAEYDEQKISKAIDKKLSDANIPSLKNYLYEQILKSMRAYHAGDSIASELRDILANVEVLYTKKLFQQALSLNQKGKQKALILDLPHQTILFLMMERNILSFMHAFPSKREELFNEILSVIKDLEYSTKLFYLDAQIIDVSNQYYPPRDDAAITEITKLYELLPDFDGRMLPPRSQLLYNSIAASYYFFIQEPVKAMELRKANLDIYDKNKDIQNSNKKNYVTALINFINAAHEANDLKAAEQGITILEKVDASSTTEQHYYKELIFAFKLFSLSHESESGAGSAFIKEAEDFFVLVPSASPHRNASLLRICIYYFHQNQPEKAAEEINTLLQRDFADWHKRIPVHARFLQIIIHYELGNSFLTDSLLRNCYRFLKKKKMLYEPERIILNFFKRILARPDNEIVELFIQLRTELEETAENKLHRNFFTEFNYIRWLDKKINSLKPVAFDS
ncbi:MAG: hypothetical protein H7X71_04730 [Chitinophagales bacterium]|nr:hypothetical protein [Chitinophagales bacterium]